MRPFFVITTLLCVVSGFAHGAEPGRHLFILSGQSNMARMRPEISFTPTLEKKFGKDKIIVVKAAKGGGPISMWYKKAVIKPRKTNSGKMKIAHKAGYLYDHLMGLVDKAIEGKEIKTITFVWMQGEADAVRNGKAYGTQLKAVLGQLRADLKRNDVNVVIGRLSDHGLDPANQKKYPQWGLVRDALVEVAESETSGAWVSTDDLNDGGKQKNGLHYTTEGYKTLGLRFAEKAIALIKKNESNSKE